MSQQLKNNNIVTIEIKTEYDDQCAQEEYQRLLDQRNDYINKGFSVEQSKYFNRRNEDIMRKLENGWMDCIYIDVKATILMPCGHEQEFYDGLGGCFVENRKDVEDIIRFNQMIDNVKQQIKDAGIVVSEYEIKEFDW